MIPARGGSKRIPGKNIKLFNGVPMLVHSIDAARRSGLFDRIIVSTDSDEVATLADEAGAECNFRRPEELADDFTPTAPVILHALQWLSGQGEPADVACCIYATAPFIQSADLRAAHDELVAHGCGSVFTVTRFAFPIFRALKSTEQGTLAMYWPEFRSTRSQDLPEAYHDAGQFYWLNVPRFMAQTTLYFDDSRPLILPRWRVEDIDTLEDWDRAAILHRVLTAEGLLA